jgi:hypothetical protein
MTAKPPGFSGIERVLTSNHAVHGLDRYPALLEGLQNASGAIKIFCEVAVP